MAYFNENFNLIKEKSKLSLNNMGKRIGKYHLGSPIKPSTLQMYLQSTTPSLEIIEAIVKFVQEYLDDFNAQDLLFTDLNKKNFTLPSEKVEAILDEDQKENTIEVDIDIYNNLIKQNILFNNLLIEKIERLEKA